MKITPEKVRQHAVLLREIGQDMLQRMQFLTHTPERILDCGCGPDVCTSMIKTQHAEAKVIGVDDDAEFIAYAAKHSPHLEWHCAAYTSLPFNDASFDVIFANLCLPRATNIQAVLHEMHRVLKPNGALFASVLGEDTRIGQEPLRHLKLLKISQAAEQVVQMKFVDPVLEMDYLTLRYPDEASLLEELQALRMIPDKEGYSQEQSTQVTFDVIVLHAFKLSKTLTVNHDGGTVSISLQDLRKELPTVKVEKIT